MTFPSQNVTHALNNAQVTNLRWHFSQFGQTVKPFAPAQQEAMSETWEYNPSRAPSPEESDPHSQGCQTTETPQNGDNCERFIGLVSMQMVCKSMRDGWLKKGVWWNSLTFVQGNSLEHFYGSQTWDFLWTFGGIKEPQASGNNHSHYRPLKQCEVEAGGPVECLLTAFSTVIYLLS